MKILLSLIGLLLLCSCGGQFIEDGYYDIEMTYISSTWPEQMEKTGQTTTGTWIFEQVGEKTYNWKIVNTKTDYKIKIKKENLVFHSVQKDTIEEIGEYILTDWGFSIHPTKDNNHFEGKAFQIFMPDIYNFREDLKIVGKKTKDLLTE